MRCTALFNHESPLRGREFVTRKITDAVVRMAFKALDVAVDLLIGSPDKARHALGWEPRTTPGGTLSDDGRGRPAARPAGVFVLKMVLVTGASARVSPGAIWSYGAGLLSNSLAGGSTEALPLWWRKIKYQRSPSSPPSSPLLPSNPPSNP
ncbi:GDP-mannose 4,6-dehydratase [Acidithiobacillus sp. M4-SHS-6]|uniref:GDP-mannose 4,6-dehydratase n=1 Tax=Acidithiobacillus sp. M4-SHS-6 TaxID=3383024 RepID=UPI0039BE1A9D